MNMDIKSFFKSNKVIGLHIGVETVDVVVLKNTPKGPKLVTFGQAPIFPKEDKLNEAEAINEIGLSDDSVKKPEKSSRNERIVEAIKRLFEELNIKPMNVVCSISNEEAMVRYFQMPKMPRNEWDTAIHFEAKRYIPFRIEDVSSDYKVIKNKSTSSNNMEVLFIAVKESSMSDLLDLLGKAGINPVIVEPASFSLLRAFNKAEEIDMFVNTAIVSIDSTIASINILKKGIPYIVRDITFEEYVSSEKVSNLIFEKLLAEIKLSFDFYEKQFPSEIIDKIIIYSNIDLGNWHEVVGKELQVPVELGDPFRGIKMKKGVVPPKLAVAYGLALRDTGEAFLDINLYKEKLVSAKQKEVFLRVFFVETFVAIIFLLVGQFLAMKALGPLSNELKKILSERPKTEASIDTRSIKELEELRDSLSLKKELMSGFLKYRSPISEKLAVLARVAPDNIWLTSLSFNETENIKDISKNSKELELKGYSLTKGDVAGEIDINNFLSNLRMNLAFNKDLQESGIISVNKTDMHNEKIDSFEILFKNKYSNKKIGNQ